MKKYIVILTILFLVSLCNAQLTIYSRPDANWWSGHLAKDIAWKWAKATDGLVNAGLSLGTGKIFYVDSNVTTEGNGTTWETAKDTLDEAVNLCTDSRGDVILVAQGHAETFIAQAADLDVIGISVIGMGRGSLRPTFTYNHANAEMAIGADNVYLSNCVFQSTITLVLMGIEVEADMDYFEIDGCSFIVDDIAADEFLEAINFNDNNTGCVVRNCYFNAAAAGAEHAIFMDADTDQTSIVGNDIRGDYSVACIGGDTAASTDLLIRGNTLINGSLVGDTGINEVAAIVLLDSTAGLIADNYIVSDVATGLLMRVADDMTFMNNWITDRDGDEFGGAIETTSATITIFVDGG